MSERTFRKIILTAVFVLALFVSSFILNRGNADMTADMGSATFPTISFETEGYEVNLLAGHRNEMDLSAMRDTITPIDQDGSLTGYVENYDQTIDSLMYQVYTADGKEKLLEETEEQVGKTVEFQLENVLEDNEEGVLKITLSFGDEQAFYYTRIIESADLNIKECLQHVETLHTNMIEKTNTDVVKRSMEESSAGKNSTLQHVDIHSNLEHSTWGDLKPEIVGEVQYEIKETKEAYTSVLLEYRVKCAGDDNDEEFYRVQEFFRVSHSGERSYLLTYDRTVDEIFDGSNVVLTSKGINLGLTTEDIQYKMNSEGTIVAFVQANELWSYNKEEDEFALVFSFADSEKEDIRNYNDDHSVKILSMEENGNITFGVYGYMNRGSHEGESGVAIYYFYMNQNAVEEKAFIPSNQSKLMIEEEIGEMAYYNNGSNSLYVLMEDTLYKIDTKRGEKEAFIEGLQAGKYVSSKDGRFLAYQTNEAGTEVEVMDFQNVSTLCVKTEGDEMIQPLGFLNGDFVYGISKAEDAGSTSSGEIALAMYKIEIRDSENKVVKTYQIEGTYIMDVSVEGNMITLERAVKRNGVYESTTKDYITNNEENINRVVLKSYWTDLKETQYRLVFEDGIDNKKAKVLKPKLILTESNTTIDFENTIQSGFYSVYGLGELAGLYAEAGDAVKKADEISGVVISPKQNYVWEDGNRVSWYRNFEMSGFAAKQGESTLAASVRAVLEYEGKTVDVAAEMQSKTAYQVLEENIVGEAVRFQGCNVADMRYLIDKGTPVVAITGSSSAIVLIGYDAQTVTYIDPVNGAIRNKQMTDVDEMMAAGGYTFLGYVQ